MITLTEFCQANGIDALARQDFTNWLLDYDYHLDERTEGQWWHLWLKFLMRGE